MRPDVVVVGAGRGVPSFLFTDAEHRRVLRDVFARHGGMEVDTQGDAFFVAFGQAKDALGAACDAQQSLIASPMRVRIGLHTGEPLLTEEGYVGIDVHRAARIAAAGHGGQILLSQSTRDLVSVEDLRDLGEHRLKDLTAPERIYRRERQDPARAAGRGRARGGLPRRRLLRSARARPRCSARRADDRPSYGSS